jgi:hypothetical protein
MDLMLVVYSQSADDDDVDEIRNPQEIIRPIDIRGVE